MTCKCYIGETESLGNPVIRKCALCESAPKLTDRLNTLERALGQLIFACKNQNQITAFGGLLERTMKEAEAILGK